MGTSPIVRQLFVALAPLMAAFSSGGAMTYPTVLLHQLRLKGASIELDFETSTWIGSIHGLAGLPTVLIPSLMQWKGRKLLFIISCLVVISGWMVLLAAKNTAAILFSECLHGFGTTSIFTISFLSISEMMSPQYRETFMQMYVLVQVLAMAIEGLLTQYLDWKTIALVMMVPMVLSLLIALVWPESPHWLAYKGEMEKCETAFLWLRGDGFEAKNELSELIAKQKNENTKKSSKKAYIRTFLHTFVSRDFYVPAFHMFVLQYFVHWSGTTTIIIYSMELINKATKNKNATFFSGLIVNSILMCGIIISAIIRNYMRKKTILLSSAVSMIICLIGASSILYLQIAGILGSDTLFSMYFILGYVLCGSFGIMSLAYPVSTSLMPVRYRGLGGALFVINTCVLQSTSLKLAPYLFFYIDLWGTFLVYAANTIICSYILWKYIPDTEGMTLQEIEDYYSGYKRQDSKTDMVELEPIAPQFHMRREEQEDGNTSSDQTM